MTATDRLNAMQQRCDAATEGPWTPRDCGDDCCVWVETHVSRGQDDHTIPFGREDGAFIAHARTDLPATIAALREFSRRHHEAAMAWGGVECSCGRDRYCPDLAILRKFAEALT